MAKSKHKYHHKKSKANEKSWDGGRSILHVPKSLGGFCKTGKKGKLGKNCIYFQPLDGRCTLYLKWCRSANCPSYKRKPKNDT